MRTRRFDFNFTPLILSAGLTAEGSVSHRQEFDADTGEYTPDYTLAPLALQPHVSVMDKDGIIPAGSVNASLTNIRWYENTAGARRLITDAGDDSAAYAITRSGADAGHIIIRRNGTPGVDVTLEFHAEYVDPRSGQIHVIDRSFLLRCANATRAIPRLELDAADQTIYNPLTDPNTQVIHATLRSGPGEYPADNRIFVWETFRPDGSWAEIGSDPALDYDTVISPDGTACTVNRRLMGTGLQLRCRAHCWPDGIPQEYRPNLLPGTEGFSGWNTWASLSAGEGPDGTAARIVDNTGSTTNVAEVVRFDGLNLEPDTVYTMSFWACGSGTLSAFVYPGVGARFYNINGEICDKEAASDTRTFHTLTDEWQRFFIVFRTLDSDDLLDKKFLLRAQPESRVAVSGPMLEVGANASPVWRPGRGGMIGALLPMDPADPFRIISQVRRIPRFEFDIAGVPANIPTDTLELAPELAIWDSTGPIPDPERELLPLWYMAPNSSATALDYSLVAHGTAPIIPTSAIDSRTGAVMGLDVVDIGPLCAMEDSDGALFTDSTGAIILIK